MAELYIDNNQLDDAKALYLERLNKDPLSADAMFNLGLIYEREEQWDKALATWRKFSKGLSLAPTTGLSHDITAPRCSTTRERKKRPVRL